MAFFKKRATAAVILAVCICLAVFLGVNRSLQNVTESITLSFYNGIYVEESGYTAPGIDALLDSRIDAALGLYTIAAEYSEFQEKAEALRAAREALLAAEDIPAKYQANSALDAAVQDIYPALLDASGLSDTDAADADYYAETLNGAQASIQQNGYNDSVAEYYERTLRTFPLNVLGFLNLTRGPQPFGEEAVA